MSKVPASARMRRMLALIPWVAAHDGPSVEEVCRRFGISREALVADINVVFLVGTYPYTPDQLIEAIVEDDRVWIRYADMFARPLRLTPTEGLALVAAGEAILATPGADPDGTLASGLAKVAGVLGIEPGAALDVGFGAASNATFELLRKAIDTSQPVRLDYYSAGTDQRSVRVVEPWSLWTYQGNWYLRGFCRSAGGERIFRLDRIAGLTPEAGTFEAPADPTDPPTVLAGELREAVLELEPEGRWAAESTPPSATEELADGRLRVTFAVASDAWLTRLLLQLGAAGKVVTPGPSAAADAQRVSKVAAQLLERYRP